MTQAFEALKLTDKVYWVGAIDWSIRNFHGYLTSRGTTYNAFLVVGEKTALIDTVKPGFGDEMMARIASVMDPSEIDFVISNHAEMDHSGCLPETVATVRPEKLIASKAAVPALAQHFHNGLDVTAVANGETLSLGDSELTFVETKMLHWPESMVTYFGADSVLFSQDAFGMHLASAERYVDELPWDIVEYETAKYFANIVLPYAPVVLKALSALDDLNLDVDLLATDHGPLWRQTEHMDWVTGKYHEWSKQEPSKKAVVVYDTMWGSTDKMARAIGEGLSDGGAHPKLMPLGGTHRSDVATEVLTAGALVVGSPTLNKTLYPTVADVLAYLTGLTPKNLVGGAFGSHGWGGQGSAHVKEALEKMKVDLVAEELKIQYVPDGDGLAQCRAWGKTIADALMERV
ncbi:MAG: FprA family A-type flavoprotein [Armatimonadia bacterium]|nr:FprA family A-type flavoprotein [Armatimonadia bacterium]